jgi:gamma-aminobutyric acid type B receptor
MFSALFIKTWRAWRIFHERSLKVIKLTNVYLLKIMAIAPAIEIAVLTIWSAVFTPQSETVVVDINRPALNYRTCTSAQSLPFAIILIVYKALLIIAGVVLGFWSRKIRSEYNESKFILIAMYNITFSAIILLVLFAIQLSDRYIYFLIRSIAILWGVTATLCVLFIPKIYYIMTGSKDPTKKRGVWSAGLTLPSSRVPDSLGAAQEQVLREKIAELKASDRKHRGDSARRSANASKNSNAIEAETSYSAKISWEEC